MNYEEEDAYAYRNFAYPNPETSTRVNRFSPGDIVVNQHGRRGTVVRRATNMEEETYRVSWEAGTPGGVMEYNALARNLRKAT